MKALLIVLAAAAALLLAGCAFRAADTGGDAGYKRISQDEAKKLMQEDNGHIIVDVRREDEFAAGHIPNAVCIPNESIGKEKPKELPDFDQMILAYCRSGRRSKEAAKKLAAMGYTNVLEFGGINSWTGETTR